MKKTIFFILLIHFITISVHGQKIDSTIYFQLRKTDPYSTTYYYRRFYNNGFIALEGWYKIEKRDYIKYYNSGSDFNKYDLVVSKYGKWIYCYPNGKIREIENIPINKETDTTIDTHFDSYGDTLSEFFCVIKFPQPLAKSGNFHDHSGNVSRTKYFRFKNYIGGKLRRTYLFINGKRDGEWYKYNKNGVIIKKTIYSNGKKISISY